VQYIGPLTYPQLWGPVRVQFHENATYQSVVIDAVSTASLYLRAEFADWTPLDAGWSSAQVRLEDVNGWAIGTRPALIYQRPYDVPTFTSFYVPKDQGVFSLSIRRHT
jgi:hypothetical protein